MSNRTSTAGLFRSSAFPRNGDHRIPISGLLGQELPQGIQGAVVIGDFARICMEFSQSCPELAESFFALLLNKMDSLKKNPYEKCLARSWKLLVIKRCRQKRISCVRGFLGACGSARAGSRLERISWRQAFHIAKGIKNPAWRFICLSDVMATKEELGL